MASLGKQFFINSSVSECLWFLICETCYLFELPQTHDRICVPSYLCFPRPNTEGSIHGSKGPLASCLLPWCLPDTFPLSLERYNESEENTRNWDFKTSSQMTSEFSKRWVLGRWERSADASELQRREGRSPGLPRPRLEEDRLMLSELPPCLR